MSDVAIRVEGISKRFRLGQTTGYKTLRDTVAGAVTRAFRRRDREDKDGHDHIWALKDVSFEVKRGQAVGVIGRNGSGKSTLLKILSRITTPTEGYAEIRGRAGSLLEVGTGFHPELTGRENIFLNGVVLGMKKMDIERRLEEIVAFSEIGDFLDTPVKRYSSGMYVRLAFAVAAHLEPDILMVDEVLAVGDAAFQRKCLGKMDAVTKEGRTVVFVSHNMAAVSSLCGHALLLEGGRMIDEGPSRTVVNGYLAGMHASLSGEADLRPSSLRRNSSESSLFRWTGIRVMNSRGQPSRVINLGEPFTVVMTGTLSRATDDVVFGLGLTSGLGFPLFNTHTTDSALQGHYGAGDVALELSLDPNYLGPGTYVIDLGARGEGVNDWIPEAFAIDVSGVYADKRVLRPNYDGVIMYPCRWTRRPA